VIPPPEVSKPSDLSGRSHSNSERLKMSGGGLRRTGRGKMSIARIGESPLTSNYSGESLLSCAGSSICASTFRPGGQLRFMAACSVRAFSDLKSTQSPFPGNRSPSRPHAPRSWYSRRLSVQRSRRSSIVCGTCQSYWDR